MSDAATRPPNAFPWHRFLFRSALLTVFLLLLGVALGNHAFGTRTTWAWGGIKCGDLVQHYGAGLLWKEERTQELYRGFALGDFLNAWKNEIDPTPRKGGIERFNYVYAPLVAWASALGTQWSYATWVSLWIPLCLAAFLGSYAWLRGVELSTFPLEFVPLLLFFGFPSFYFALIPGQNTPLTLFIACAATWCLARRSPWIAGLVFSCAFYKPQLMPSVFLFMLAAGQWRFALALAWGNLLWLVLGLGLCGFPAHAAWIESLRDMSAGLQFQKPGMNQSWTGLVSLFQPDSPGLRTAASLVFGLGVPGAAGWFFRKSILSRDPRAAVWAVMAALAVGLVASPYLGYYEVLLGLPWAWVTTRRDPGTRGIVWAVVFWLISWVAVGGVVWTFPLAAPLLAVWLLVTFRVFSGKQSPLPDCRIAVD
jgi:hypothetical protein